jgi:YfiH family protein
MVMGVLYNANVPPAVSEEFEWTDSPLGTLLVARAFPPLSHGWTTRQLELHGGPEREQRGWDRVAAAAGLRPDQLVRLRQVHGAAVFVADNEVTPDRPEADIVLTARADVVVAVQVADCAPVLLASRSGAVAGAAHAGWRGTAAGVSGVAVRALVERFAVDAASLSAAIGPAIGPCCYEVGEELLSAFAERGWDEADRNRWFIRRDGRLFLDVWQANADQLRNAGIPGDQIHVSRLCTSCHPEWFYSYRREGAGTGRLAAFIRPRPPHA